MSTEWLQADTNFALRQTCTSHFKDYHVLFRNSFSPTRSAIRSLNHARSLILSHTPNETAQFKLKCCTHGCTVEPCLSTSHYWQTHRYAWCFRPMWSHRHKNRWRLHLQKVLVVHRSHCHLWWSELDTHQLKWRMISHCCHYNEEIFTSYNGWGSYYIKVFILSEPYLCATRN